MSMNSSSHHRSRLLSNRSSHHNRRRINSNDSMYQGGERDSLLSNISNHSASSHDSYASECTEISSTSTPTTTPKGSIPTATPKQRTPPISSWTFVLVSVLILGYVTSNLWISASSQSSYQKIENKIIVYPSNHNQKIEIITNSTGKSQSNNLRSSSRNHPSTTTTTETTTTTVQVINVVDDDNDSANDDQQEQQESLSSKSRIDQLLHQETIILPQPSSSSSINNNTNHTNSSSASPGHDKLPKIGICHRTMYGSELNWNRIKEWIVYYRLLGVDRFFLGYVPDLANTTLVEELAQLPYVDLWLDTRTKLSNYTTSNGETVLEPARGKGAFDQKADEQYCISERANKAGMDWVLTIDYDEFWWTNDFTTLKQFIYKQQQQHGYTYLSFGKYMYDSYHHIPSTTPDPNQHDDNQEQTQEHQQQELNLFEFESFPWTPGPFCAYPKLVKKRGANSLQCPYYPGRSKIAVKLPHDGMINIHGNYADDSPERKVFRSNETHLKEWANYHLNGFSSGHSSLREYEVPRNTNFGALQKNETGIHQLDIGHQRSKKLKNKIDINYDGNSLQEWLKFLVNGSA